MNRILESNSTQLGSIVYHRIRQECNDKFVELNITLQNDGVHDTIINITFETFGDLENILIISKVNLPEDKNDNLFKKEYFKTTIDLKRMSKMIKGNALMRYVAEHALKSLDFELKFPLKKVILL